jgi:hypothetical protein
MANRLNRPVALADTLGDVWDALTGQSKVLYQPGVAPTTDPIALPMLDPDDLNPTAHFS